MQMTPLLVWVGSLLLVLWWTRRIPLTGPRRVVVTVCRLGAVSLLCLALLGLARRSVAEQPQHVVYLVDGSESIDPRQREWIARRVSSLDAIRPPQVPRAVIAFGGNALTVMPFAHESLTDPSVVQAAVAGAEINRSDTNLEAALLEALRLLPVRQGGHLMLFSDGGETTGDAARVLAHVRRLGISVYPVPIPVFGKVPPVWETLSVPPVVQRGAPVNIQMALFSRSPDPKLGYVTINLSGYPIQRKPAWIRPGWQVLTTSVTAIQSGTMELDVQLSIPDEGLEEHRLAFTEVEGPPHVLMVDDDPTVLSLLGRALKRQEMEISLVQPEDLPTQALPLLDYDAVMLYDVPKSSLADGQVRALRSYVETFGGGLLMVGLGGELSAELSTPSPLDDMLPVDYEAKGLQEAQRRVCMIMLIDRSASMLGPRIAATKRAAIELIKQLEPEDLVGLLAFDTKPYVVVEVQPSSWVGPALIEKLVRLRSTGGTDVYPALISAKARLDQTGATLKHIILLSDGNTPFRRDVYDALAAEFKADEVSVSTIGIGSAFVNVKYLRWLADQTGGTYYQLRSLDELPKLIAFDTQAMLDRLPFTEGYFHPQRSPTTDWFAEVSDLPVLRGYLTTTAKPGAQVDVTVRSGDTDDPLLARWFVGRGRVTAYTSDADTRWSPEWIRWPGYDAWWAEVVRWTMRRRHSEEMFVWVDERSGTARLVLEGRFRDPTGRLMAADGSGEVPLSFVQSGQWRWYASLDQAQSGWHEFVLEFRLPGTSDANEAGTVMAAEDDEPIFASRWVQIGTTPVSDELTGQPPREALLRQLAHATGGRHGVPDLAFIPPTTTATSQQPLLPWFLLPVILLLLVDVAFRGTSML